MEEESGCLPVKEEAGCPSAYLLTQLEQEVILELQVRGRIGDWAVAVLLYIPRSCLRAVSSRLGLQSLPMIRRFDAHIRASIA